MPVHTHTHIAGVVWGGKTEDTKGENVGFVRMSKTTTLDVSTVKIILHIAFMEKK